MISIDIKRGANGTVQGYRMSGHALYAEHGQDIVCAGVSAVAFGTVNAVEQVAGVELNAEVAEGDLQVDVPELGSHESERVQLLLESMLVMLRTIEDEYGEHVQIKEWRDMPC